MAAEPANVDSRDGSVKSVERCIDLLLCLTAGPKTLTEIGAQVDLSKSTTRRLLRTLGYGGLVVFDPLSKHYLLGPGCLRLGQGFVSGQGGFSAFARMPLRDLWTKTGESVAVHVRLGRQRVCVDELPSAEAVRYMSGVGTVAPIHVGSAGRVLLGFMPPQDLTTLLDGMVLQSYTTGAVMDPVRFRKELETLRRRGYAMSEGERVRGAAAISVPVFGPDGIIAALSVLGPAGRFSRRNRLDALDELRRAAAAIQDALHAVDPPNGSADSAE